MSWDVFIQHLPASALTVDDVPDDFSPLPLGTRTEVVEKIRRAFPTIDLTDPTWGVVDAASYSIQFALGADHDEQLYCVSLHVRGDESVVPPIAALIEDLGARALDSWTGEFFDPVVAAESIRRWRAYLDESS
jgi:hypothetical protein